MLQRPTGESSCNPSIAQRRDSPENTKKYQCTNPRQLREIKMPKGCRRVFIFCLRRRRVVGTMFSLLVSILTRNFFFCFSDTYLLCTTMASISAFTAASRCFCGMCATDTRSARHQRKTSLLAGSGSKVKTGIAGRQGEPTEPTRSKSYT